MAVADTFGAALESFGIPGACSAMATMRYNLGPHKCAEPQYIPRECLRGKAMGPESTDAPRASHSLAPRGTERPGPRTPRGRVSPPDIPSVGRAEELRKLDAALVQADRGHGSSWLVSGPSGIGKTRLLREVARLAERRGFRVYWAYGLRGTSLPLFTLLQLRTSLGAPVAGARPSSPPRSRAGRPRPESVDGTILAILRDLDRAQDEGSVLVILDDLQYADAESLRGLRLLVRRFVDRPVVFLLAARPAIPGTRSRRVVEAELDEVLRSDYLTTLELRPLSRSASLQLAASVLGQPPETVGRLDGLRDLLDLAAGSPYFVIEIARAYLARPETARSGSSGAAGAMDGETRAGPPGVPPIVRQSILRRYGALPKEVRRLLDLAAHIGFEFDGEALAVAFRRTPGDIARELEAVATERWPIRAVAGPGRRYSFDHSLLHSIVLEQGAPPSAVVLRRVIRWWGAHRSDDPATEARLHRLAGDRLGTIRSIGRAIEGAVDSGAYRLVSAYVAELPTEVGPDRAANDALVALYAGVVRGLRERWEWEAQRDPLERLQRLELSDELRWTARFWTLDAEAFRDRGRVRDELERLDRELAPPRPPLPDEGRRMWLYLRAVLVHAAGADRGSAMATLRRAIRELDDGRHDFELFRVLITGAMTFPNWGRYAEARAWTARARVVLHRGRLESAWLSELLRGPEWVLELRAGDLTKGLRLSEESVRSARRLKSPSLEAAALLNQGICEFEVRDYEAADRALSEAGELYENLDHRFGLLWSLILRALGRAGRGEWAEADALLERCRPILVETNSPYESWLVQLGHAFVTAAKGNPAAGLASLPESPAPGPDPKAFAIEYRCIRSRMLELKGDLPAARALLEEVYRETARGASAVERAEVLVHLAEWERRTGSPERERHYRRLLRKIHLAGGAPLLIRRRGIACGEISRPGSGPAALMPAGLHRGATRAPVAPRILELLRRHRKGPPWLSVRDETVGWSELDIARGLGVPRESLVRALGRLLVAGSVERIAHRPHGTARRVYRYTLREPERSPSPVP